MTDPQIAAPEINLDMELANKDIVNKTLKTESQEDAANGNPLGDLERAMAS